MWLGISLVGDSTEIGVLTNVCACVRACVKLQPYLPTEDDALSCRRRYEEHTHGEDGYENSRQQERLLVEGRHTYHLHRVNNVTERVASFFNLKTRQHSMLLQAELSHMALEEANSDIVTC